MRTTELLKSQKEFEKRNQELLQNQREVKRTAVVETIITVITSYSIHYTKLYDRLIHLISPLGRVRIRPSQFQKESFLAEVSILFR